MSVVDKDMGYKEFMKKIEQLSKEAPYVKVGVLEGEAEKEYEGEDALTTVQVATFHEFGTSNGIPERSFLRSTHDEKQGEIFQIADKIVFDTFFRRNQTIYKGLSALGLWFVQEVRAKIRSGIQPPLKSRQGTPLIDTGQLIQSLTYKVEGADK